LSPYLLLAALSSKPVVAQIQSKRFTQDIIDTLGNRVYELVLPIPKDRVKRERIEKMVEKSVSDRIEARELARIARDEIA
jgi:type I restriction enzyme M protein